MPIYNAIITGTGSHLPFLAEHYEVEGLDLSREMLAIAREKCPGVTFHEGDMRDFALPTRFDVVVCLCSSIGYALTVADLDRAIATMAHHLRLGGVLVVEPFFGPAAWTADRTTMMTVDEPDLKVARLSRSSLDGATAIIDYHYLVATPEGVQHHTEQQRLGLFTDDQYIGAFLKAGLQVHHDPHGRGRGLFLGVREA